MQSFQKSSYFDSALWQMLSVCTEVFNFISPAKIAAIGVNAEIYRHSQALNEGFIQEKLQMLVIGY